MSSYYVRSVCYIGALPERVWNPLIEVENWSQWWPEVLSSMELESGVGVGHGSLKRCTWRGAIPPEFVFNLRITRVVRCSLLEAEVRGHLEGTTRWVLTPQDEGCAIRMEWSFRTNKWWMEFAKDSDIAVHECFAPPKTMIEKQKFTPGAALNVSTQIHTSPGQFGKVMSSIKPRLAVGYHFFNDFDTAPVIYEELVA